MMTITLRDQLEKVQTEKPTIVELEDHVKDDSETLCSSQHICRQPHDGHRIYLLFPADFGDRAIHFG